MTDHKHDHDGPECGMCKTGQMDQRSMNAWEIDAMKKSGFYVHYVSPIPGSEFVNFHTHGFRKSWDHPDFQIIIPIPPKVGHSLFWDLVDRVKAGEKFKDGDEVDELVRNFPVRLVTARETGRDVLRIIIPDKDGRFPGDAGVSELFSQQPDAIVDVV